MPQPEILLAANVARIKRMTDLTPRTIDGQIFDPVEDGRIAWVADEVIGFKCGCGNDEVLTLTVYDDFPAECSKCHARFYYKQRIEIICVTDD
jgi:hypothetical protein